MGKIAYDPSRSALYTPENRDTLFESGKDYSLAQIALEAARLAYFKAETSTAEMQRLTDALRTVGFDAPTLLFGETTGTRAFACYRPVDAMALISFRGTQPDAFDDLVTDSSLLFVDWRETGGKVHRGFAAAFRGIRPQIQQWLQKTNARSGRLILTGHSLGAALATLTAAVFPSGLLLTLGSPRVGNEQFIGALKRLNILRLVNCCDLVTDVPPELGGYRHTAASLYIDAAGRLSLDPSWTFVAQDRLQAEFDYATTYSLAAADNVLLRRLADHAPINYARAFFSSRN